jgi:hypothetical protein
MHHPLAITHHRGVILRHLQIIHHPGRCERFPARDDPNAAIGAQQAHAYRERAGGSKTLILRQEGMLAGRVDGLALRAGRLAIMGGRLDREGQLRGYNILFFRIKKIERILCSLF